MSSALAVRKPELFSAWPATLALDVALGILPIPDVLDKHGLSYDEWEHISELPAFRAELVAVGKEIQEKGVSFKKKCAFAAESYLMDMDGLMHDNTVAPGVKVDIFKTLATYGELAPIKGGGEGGGNGPQFAIQINIK